MISYLLIVLITISTTFFTLSTWAMEQEEDEKIDVDIEMNNSIPFEILCNIFQYLDLKDLLNVSLVSKDWNEAANDDIKVWQPMIQAIYPDIKSLKAQSETFKEFLKNSFIAKKKAEHVLTMEKWGVEEIEASLLDENYLALKRALVKTLELSIISMAIKQQISTPKNMLSALFAYHIISESVSHITRKAGEMAAWDIIKHVPCIWCVPKHTAEYIASHVWGFAWYATWHTTTNAPFSISWHGKKDPAEHAASSAITAIKELFTKEKLCDEIIWKLASNYVLAYFAQNKSIDEHFMYAYNLVEDGLNEELNFNPSIENILQRFAQFTWDKAELANNPYIESLKRIAETLADHIQAQAEALSE